MAAPVASPKQWMLGLPGHNEIMRFEEVLVLVKDGQLRPTDLVKKLGEPWKAANEIPELMEYFAEPKRIPKVETPKEAPKPPPPPPAAAKPPPPPPAPPPRNPPPRPMTARIPTAPAAPPVEKKPPPTPPPKPAPAEAVKSETRPDPSKAETKADAPKVEAPVAPSRSPAEETKPAPLEPKEKDEKKDKEKPKGLRDRRTRDVPKAPVRVEPLLEPMVGKYLGPVDLLRCASFAFDPRKLLMVAVGVGAMGILTGLLWHLSGDRNNSREWAMAIAAGVVWVFGISYISVTLAYVTRRQIEGQEYRILEMVRTGALNALLSVIYPAFAIGTLLVSLLVLYGFKYIRNTGSGGASFVKLMYFLPMAVAFVGMAGALLYQLATMYVPAAAAIEGTRVTASVNAAWNTIRRQWGRVVLHWLIITVAVGVITVVGVGLAAGAVALPVQIFGVSDNTKVMDAWENFSHLFSMYQGLAIGLGLTLPVSLLSTLGTLSYVSLRHPASAQLSPSAMDETGGIAIGPSGTRHGTDPGEQTQPGDTRPAPPDATRPGPGMTPPPSDITDDSDEQPLVKDE